VSTLPEPRRFTTSEYLRMSETGVIRPDERVELIDGQVVAMSPQGPVHAALVARIGTLLAKRFPDDRFCIRQQSTLVLGEDYVPEPDIAVAAGRCQEHEREWPKTILLVVEVSDTTLRLDRGRKSDLYGRAGVQEYWIVNVSERVVEVRREPSPAGFKSIRILQPEDEVAPPGPDGTAIRASELLPIAT
jgi:Uma2 family endonuclease